MRPRTATVDGVLLSLHGAQSAVDEPDVSGRMLEAVRAAVGSDVPIAATLDLHANVTPLMARCADVLVGYHTFPHVDHVSCGRRAAGVPNFLKGESQHVNCSACGAFHKLGDVLANIEADKLREAWKQDKGSQH